jgi:hypothetical protein
LWVAASRVAEKLSSLVGRAFRHDIKAAFALGVLTPECLKPQFSAACLAVEVMSSLFCRRQWVNSVYERNKKLPTQRAGGRYKGNQSNGDMFL